LYESHEYIIKDLKMIKLHNIKTVLHSVNVQSEVETEEREKVTATAEV